MVIMRQQGLVPLLGLVSLVLLLFTGCMESGEEQAAISHSRLTVQIRTAEPTSGGTSRTSAQRQARAVVPGDRDYLTRLDLRIEADDLATPITQSVTLTEAQQQEVTVEFLVPVGSNRRVIVGGFNALDEEVFHGEATVNLTQEIQQVTITLLRQFLPAFVTPDDFSSRVSNHAFRFADGAAFGIDGQVTLTFGALVENGNTGPFTLTSDGFRASGRVTVTTRGSSSSQRRAASVGQLRQDEFSTLCNFTVEESNYPSGEGPQEGEIPMACQIDEFNDSMSAENLNTGVISFSDPPVLAANNAPVAVADSATVAEGGLVTALEGGATSVLANDTDAETDPLTASLVSDVSNGTLTLHGDGTFSYTHDGSETTSDSFTYQANDGALDSAPATVTITVTPVNDAPVVTNPGDQINDELDAVQLQIVASDPDGDTLTFSTTGLPQGLDIDETGLITGTIALAAAAGSPYTVTVTATDNGTPPLSSDPITFTWTVREFTAPNTTRIGSRAVQPGDTFTVPVVFNAGATDGVFSLFVELSFDSSVVQVIGIEGVTPFDEVVTNEAAFSTGTVRIVANNTTFAPANGLLTLVNITFQVVGNSGDTSLLSLDFAPAPGGAGVFVNNSFQPIEGITFVNGSVTVQ